MQIILGIFSFILGSCIGSFLNVVNMRLVKEQSLGGRSHCFGCHKTLQFLDLVPIFSFIFLQGRCRYCKNPISSRYFISEIFMGFLFLFGVSIFPISNLSEIVNLLKYFVVISGLFVVFVIDFEHFLIYDIVLYITGGLILFLNLVLDIFSGNLFTFNSIVLNSLVAGFFAWLPFYSLWFFSKGRWMGYGDVKLAFLLGVILGYPNIFVGLFLAFILGGLVSIVLLLFFDKKMHSRIPFGTFLSIGTVIAMLYGEKLLKMYLFYLGF